MVQRQKRGLNRRNASKDVAEYIRGMILEGEIKPSEKIPQDEVADELGVSRIPVREALFTLASEGYVVLEPYRGAFVSPLERADVEDQFEMYALVHGLAAAHAIDVADDEWVAQLQELHTRFRDCNDPEELDEIDWNFHRTINLAGGSRRLRTVLRILTSLSRNVPRNFWLEAPEAKRAAVRGHSAIVRAFQERDPVKVRDACYKHMRQEGIQVADIMKKNGFWVPRSKDGSKSKARVVATDVDS